MAMDWLPTKEIKRTCGQDSLEWHLQEKRQREPEAPKHLKANKDVGTLGEMTYVAKGNINGQCSKQCRMTISWGRAYVPSDSERRGLAMMMIPPRVELKWADAVL